MTFAHLRCVVAFSVLVMGLNSGLSAQVANQFESHLVGRWVVDNPAMCKSAKFTGAGIYNFYDKAGKLIQELRLPEGGQVKVVRRGAYKTLDIFDQSSLVIKTVVLSENLQSKTSYTTFSLLQFSEDFKTQTILDQSMDGVFNIRDSVVLATKQKQSPFYKCDSP